MQPLDDIFNTRRFFRIPIYQRGYSWQTPQLEAFWNDIDNLTNNNHNHYMGMIGVQELNQVNDSYKHWNNYDSKFVTINDSFYHIVDGQQRLTTILILISEIIHFIDNSNDNWFRKDIDSIQTQYIFRQSKKDSPKFYYFGYEADTLSEEFLIETIFNGYYRMPTNIYTKNIIGAKGYFQEKLIALKEKSNGEFQKILRNLYDILTTRLQFDFNPFKSEEISMIFETMNDRGKPLSNLEKLKNRLIYLTTLFYSTSKSDQSLTVSKIANTWATIFRYMGQFQNYKSEDDDSFLKNHWIMYTRFDKKEAEFYRKDIFEREFTVKKILNRELTIEMLNEYIESLEKSIPKWYLIFNPKNNNLDCKNKKILSMLNKLNYIGFKGFAPIILTAFYKNESEDEIVQLLTHIEKHIFLLFYFSFRKADIGTYNFLAKASHYFKNEKNLKYILDDIYYNWTYGSYTINKPASSYIEPNNFVSVIKDHFAMSRKYGYYSWSGRTGIKYFLMEYELSINSNINPVSINYSEYFVELILSGAIEINGDEETEEEVENEQKIYFEDVDTLDSKYLELLTDKKNNITKEDATLRLKKLKYTLGNLVLVKKNYSSEQRKMSFEERKSILPQNNMLENEKEAFSYQSWKPIDILNRGIKLLEFMEKRWGFAFDDWKIDKRKVLFLDFIDPNQ